MALPGVLTFTDEGLARITVRFGLGELHSVLRGPAQWYDTAEEDALEREAFAECERLRLFERRGVLDRDFEDSLKILCRPAEALYGWITENGAGRQVLAGSWWSEGVLAVRQQGTITLRQISPQGLAPALVAQLPEGIPARFQPILLPVTELAAGNQRGGSAVMQRVNAGGDDSARRIVEQLATARQLGGAELYVGLRDQVGRSRRSETSLGYSVTEYGACLNTVRYTNSGEQQLFVAPATPQEMTRHLGEMRGRLQSAGATR